MDEDHELRRPIVRIPASDFFYGLLDATALSRGSWYRREDVLPPLQFDCSDVLVDSADSPFTRKGADTLIKMVKHTSEWLFVHGHVLGAASPVFKVELAGWGAASANLDVIVDPATGEATKVNVLELCAVDDTCVLSSKVSTSTHAFHCFKTLTRASQSVNGLTAHLKPSQKPLPNSCLAVGWPELRCNAVNEFLTPMAFHVLVAMMYGIKVTHDVILKPLAARHPEGYAPPKSYLIHSDLNGTLFATITTAAAFAEYYGCLPLLRDAFIGLLLSTPDYSVTVAEVLECTVEEVKDVYLTELGYQPTVARELETRLLKLCLNEAPVYHGGWYMGRTTLTQALRFARYKLSKSKKQAIEIEYAACSIWSQWLIHKLHGENLWRDPEYNRIRGLKAGRLNLAVERMNEAATWKNPADLFKLKRAAKEAIERTMEDRDGRRGRGCIIGHSEYNSHPFGYFTKFDLRVDLPWLKGGLDKADLSGIGPRKETPSGDSNDCDAETDDGSDQMLPTDPFAQLKALKVNIAPASRECLTMVFAAKPVAEEGAPSVEQESLREEIEQVEVESELETGSEAGEAREMDEDTLAAEESTW
ncbi:hypothetical protein B0A48_17320 [Cryoendolithus antarcticus]|uniref:Uncharacterized protein n=1 Tax=Cryoendolithus antarcticus TaxID=1507870 RepID=A0A1V8SCM3_9PEZI|nr:hypothetical protein B0A48_17320 [Cryoendolithus antarcticus]